MNFKYTIYRELISDYHYKGDGFSSLLSFVLNNIQDVYAKTSNIYSINRKVPYCKTCILKSNTPGVVIQNNGNCNICNNFSSNFIARHIKSQFDKFVLSCRNNNSIVLVPLSGGKDSIASLLLANKKLKLKVRAVMLATEFMLPKVIEQTQKLCEKNNIPLDIKYIELYPKVKIAMHNYYFMPWPCNVCQAELSGFLSEISLKYSTNKVIAGYRYLWDNGKNSVTSGENAFGLFNNAKSSFVKNLQILNILPALGINHKNQMDFLKSEEWKTEKVPGYSSNCLIPGIMERLHFEKHGRTRDQVRFLSHEVRMKIITKEEAEKDCMPPRFSEIIQFVSSNPQLYNLIKKVIC